MFLVFFLFSNSLSLYGISEDNTLYAYGTAKRGSQWYVVKIHNVQTQKEYPEELRYVRYSEISWDHEHKGFFYSVGIAVLFLFEKRLNC